ncbi:MAG: RDD family protein [Bacilli bacterium]|nr:RDD family protein [Bacilli bacterium]
MHNFERRVRSFSIDLSLAMVIFFLFILLLNTFELGTDSIKLLIAATISYFGALIVPNFFSRGQSFGKRNQKMMVISIKTNKPPKLLIAITREIFKGLLLIWTYGAYMVICGIMVNSRKDGRVVHDLVFGTKVICLTTYVTDKEQGYVLGKTKSVKKELEGSSYD